MEGQQGESGEELEAEVSHMGRPGQRRAAIRYAIEHAQPGDVILLAGKGHEDYQEIRGVHYPFDEKVVVREIFDELEK